MNEHSSSTNTKTHTKLIRQMTMTSLYTSIIQTKTTLPIIETCNQNMLTERFLHNHGKLNDHCVAHMYSTMPAKTILIYCTSKS